VSQIPTIKHLHSTMKDLKVYEEERELAPCVPKHCVNDLHDAKLCKEKRRLGLSRRSLVVEISWIS